MSDLTGVEWQGEPLAYGTIVTAPSRGIVAMVLTGMEGAMVNEWYSLRPGEVAVLVLDSGRATGIPRIAWILPFLTESIRWFVR